MGLDMFAYSTNHDVADVDFEVPDDADQIFYWRKHPNLHGWMKSLYRHKGGTGDDFNCDTVRLRADDLDAALIGTAPATRDLRINRLRTVLNHAVKKGWLQSNPGDRLDLSGI